MKNIIPLILIFISIQIFGQNPGWVVNPANFDYNGQLVGKVIKDGTAVTQGILAAFVGNECRGVASASYFPPSNHYVFQVMCYSNLTSEIMTIKYYDPISNQIFDNIGQITFTPDMIQGNALAPIVFNITTQSCQITANNSNLVFQAIASSQEVSITSNATWTVSESLTWVTVTPTSGSNNGSISVSVTANNGIARNGTITLTAACGTAITITVNQAAPCNLSASASTLDFSASVGNQTVNITSNASWTVSESLSWVTVTPTSGSNNGSISVSVTANNGSARNGTITLTAACGTVITITVNQAALCNLSASASTLDFSASAGNQTANITSTTSWTVSESLSWVTVTPTSGSNNGSISVSVTANTGSARNGTITLTAACGTVITITVNQAAPCNLSASTSTLNFSASAENQTVNISSNSTWTISESMTWLTVIPSSGSNNGSVTVSATVNPGTARSGIITLTAACGTVITITVNQAALCNLSASASTLDFSASAGNQTANITSNTSWTVSESLSWVTVTPTSGSNNGSISVSVIANNGIARNGSITLTAACGSTITITVNQAALCNLSASTSILNFSALAENQTVNITSNSTWTVSESLTWVTVTPTSGSNNGSITVSATLNPGTARSGIITLTAACGTIVTITVNQAALCNLSASTSTLNFSAAAENQTVNISSNSTWTVSESMTWLTVTPSSGSNNGSITVSATVNPGIARSGIITLTAACGTVITITVNQAALCNLSASTSILNFSASAGNQTVNISSNSTWTVSESLTWVTVTPLTGSNNGSITVSATANPGIARSGIITLTAACGTVITITVNQAAPCNLSASTSTLNFSASAGNQTVNISSNSTWTVSESMTWLTVTPSSGSNNGSITVSTIINPGIARSGLITLTAACGTVITITVNQAAPCNLSASTSTLNFSASAGNQTVNISSNSTWTVSESLSWVTVTPSSGSNNGSITVSATTNPGIARSGIITLTTACGTALTITLNQGAPCILIPSTNTLNFSASAGNQLVNISSYSSWTVSESLSWVTVTPLSGLNDGNITVSVSVNPGIARTGTITLSAACGEIVAISVNQAAPCVLSASASTLDFSASAGNQLVNISSNSTWSVTESLSWVTVSPPNGTSNNSINVFVLENPGIARSGAITLTAACGTVITITVNQSAPCVLTSSTSSLEFSESAGNQTVNISSYSSWSVSESLPWVTVTPLSGLNDGTVTVSVTENPGITRSGTITLSAACGATVIITVNQGSPCLLTPSTSSLDFSASDGNQTVNISSYASWTTSESLSWITVTPPSGLNDGSIIVSAIANTGPARSGTIIITAACGATATITVNQAAPCMLTVSASTLNFSSSAGNQTVSISSYSSWTVSESLSWVTVTPPSGSNNGLINVNVIANPGNARSGIITLSAACGTSVTISINQGTSGCALTSSSNTLIFSASAGNQTVNITSNSSWVVSESLSWVTVTPPSASNNSSISVAVLSNPGAARSGTISLIAACGTTITISVNQNAITCSLSASTNNLYYPATSGDQTVVITSNSNWTVSESLPWVAITPISGSNSGSFKVYVIANSGAARSGSVTVTAACGTTVTIFVTQSGPCTLTASSAILNFPATAGNQNVNISSNSTWSVSESLSWVTVTPTSGSNNSSINVNATANTGSARTGIITLTAACGTTVSITVNQNSGGCLLTTSANMLNFSAATGFQTVSIASNSTWSVSESLPWVVIAPTSGSDNGSFKVYVVANSGAARFGTITVTAACGTTITITVNQSAACSLTVSSSILDFSSAAGNQTVNVTSNSTWVVSESLSWVTVTPPSGSINNTINVNAAMNPGAARTGTITLTAACGTSVTITVNQAAGCSLSVSASMLNFSSAAGSHSVNITSNSSWTVSESLSWVAVTPPSGSNNNSIVVSVTSNTGGARTGTITLTSACNTSVTITVNQSSIGCTLNTSVSVLNFSSAVGSQPISISSNSTWTVSESLPWVTVSPTSGSNNGSINVSVLANPGVARTGTITISVACGISIPITINQGASCLLTASPGILYFAASEGNQTVNITSNSTWNIIESLPWVTITPTSGTNNGNINVSVSSNAGLSRIGFISLTAGCGASGTLTVSQSAPASLNFHQKP